MGRFNSKIILCHNIKLDKNYKNVLNYNTSQMLELCNQNKVASSDSYSFIRSNRNSIVVDFSYETCLSSNYIAFQNPDYSNKWFFAFVDEVIYTSDSATTINYTIDAWSTWFDNWTPNICFVEREHTNDDSIGANLQPEGIEHGEYVMASNYSKTNLCSYPCICIEATKLIDYGNVSGGGNCNRIFSGVIKYLFRSDPQVADAWAMADEFLEEFDRQGYGESIVGIYMIPENFTANATWFPITSGSDMKYGLISNMYHDIPFDFADFTAGNPNTLAGGYVPKNNKLFTYPYRYCLVSNNAGTEIPMHYEDFVNNTPVFQVFGAITPGCSLKMIPLNYKGISNNYDEAIEGAKLPIGSWSSDMYTNWLTQTSLNRNLSLVGNSAVAVVGGLQMASGNVIGGAENVGSGLAGIKNTLMEKYEHSFMPSQAKGNMNSGDINFSLDMCDYIFYHYSIKPEFARVIDDFFTRFGYQTNRLKTPNITGRRYWNYIKIGLQEEIVNGNIPSDYIERINLIAQNGTTIWHNHENIGNYSLNNSII